MQLSKLIRGTILSVAVIAAIGAPVMADQTVTYSKWVEDIKFGGDLRIRHEYFDKDTTGQADRSRQRFRLRFGWEFKLPYKLTAYSKLASGTGEQTSTNQSFDNLSSQKDLWIDLAYIKWAPQEWVTLQAGRMANPLWRTYSSDVVWDGDFNPEGASQKFTRLVGPIDLSATLMQIVLDEDSSNNVGSNTTGQQADQWLFSHQITAETRLPFEKRLKIGVANHYSKNENQGTLSQAATGEGNRRTAGGVLLNNFNVMEYTADLKGWFMRLPFSIQGTYVKNKAARPANEFTTPANVVSTEKEDYGYQAGVILGKASNAKTWEVAYFNKQVRTDATLADIADSDLGDGGTNRKGHIVWIAYAPADFILCQIKHFDTEVINPSLAPGRDDINRTQFDVSFKF